MKAIFSILFSLSLTLIPCFVTSQVYEHNYVAAESIRIKKKTNINSVSRQCSKSASRLAKQLNKLSDRIELLNRKALRLFENSLDLTLRSICVLDEERAEALMLDANYSFNRLENRLLQQGGNGIIQKYNHKFTSMTNSFFAAEGSGLVQTNEVDTCSCLASSQLNEARNRLKIAIRQNAVINEYMSDRLSITNRISGLPNFEVAGIAAFFKNYSDLLLQSIDGLLTQKLNNFSQFSNVPFSSPPPEAAGFGPTLKMAEIQKDIEDYLSDAQIGNTTISRFPNKFKENVDFKSNSMKTLNGEVFRSYNKLDTLQKRACDKFQKRDTNSVSLAPTKQKLRFNPNKLKCGKDKITFGTLFQRVPLNSEGVSSIDLGFRVSYLFNSRLHFGFFTGTSINSSPLIKLDEVEDWVWRFQITDRILSRIQFEFRQTPTFSVTLNYEKNIGIVTGRIMGQSIFLGSKVYYKKTDNRITPVVEILVDLFQKGNNPLFILRIGFDLTPKFKSPK